MISGYDATRIMESAMLMDSSKIYSPCPTHNTWGKDIAYAFNMCSLSYQTNIAIQVYHITMHKTPI